MKFLKQLGDKVSKDSGFMEKKYTIREFNKLVGSDVLVAPLCDEKELKKINKMLGLSLKVPVLKKSQKRFVKLLMIAMEATEKNKVQAILFSPIGETLAKGYLDRMKVVIDE